MALVVNGAPAGASAAAIAAAFAGDAEAAADLVSALGVSGDPGLPTSNLVALWRASDLVLSDGAAVGTWAPGVGSPGSLTGSGSARPTYRATGSPSGGPAVEFDGSDDVLALDSPSGLPTGAGAGTLVAIVSRVAGGSGLRHIAIFGTAASDQARGVGVNNAVWAAMEYVTLANGEDASPRSAAGAVLAHWYDGTTRRLFLNGAPITAPAATTLNTGTTRLALGRGLTEDYGGERSAFRVMAIAVYSAALTDAQWAQVMAHARAAYGVA